MRSGPIYPDFIPRQDAHPTHDMFEVIDAGTAVGRGLRSKAHFARGRRVARVSGVFVPSSSLDTIQMTPTLHLYDCWFCRFILHSCDPNLRIDFETLEIIALHDIAPGDYLSLDYAMTEDHLARQFACACGAANCRGWILGRKEQPTAEGRVVLARSASS